MKLVFIGADHEVTGSCHYMEVGNKHILVDYGMEQGINTFENEPLPVSPSMIDYVFLTHAHVDHSGLLPLLYAEGFRGQVYATDATADLCSIMLRDCAHIQMMEAEWKNRKAKRSESIAAVEPLYTMEDAEGVIKRIIPCHYDKEVQVCDEVKIRFTDIGHLLGSASIEVWLTEDGVTKKIVFSGDIGNKNQPLIKDPAFTKDADYVVMESTYGDRLHSKERPDFVTELAAVLKETFDRGGNVVIPSFAVGRTQQLLHFLQQIKARGLVKGHDRFPVYVDSPLANEATNIFNRNIWDCCNERCLALLREGVNPISFQDLVISVTSEDSRAINEDHRCKVILSASGMCEAGRIRHHLKHNLWRPESTILFVGYQTHGTLGRALLEGTPKVRIFGEEIEVRAHIQKLEGMSSHADSGALVGWLGNFEQKPKKVFVVHGDDAVCDSFTARLRSEFGYDAAAPYPGGEYDFAEARWITEGNRQRKQPKIAQGDGYPVSAAYQRLLAAGKRLLEVIGRNKGGTNKDLGRFAGQIDELCEKWNR